MNKTLLKSVREYKKQSFLTPFFVILEVFMEVLIPLEMAKIIDVGIANGNLNYIIQRGIILVAMAIWRPLRRQVIPKICATIFFIKSSSFHLKISTTFLLPVW